MSKEADYFTAQLRPIIGDKNFTLDEKMIHISKIADAYHKHAMENRIDDIRKEINEVTEDETEPNYPYVNCEEQIMDESYASGFDEGVNYVFDKLIKRIEDEQGS